MHIRRAIAICWSEAQNGFSTVTLVSRESIFTHRLGMVRREAGVERYASCARALPREADQQMGDGLVTERE
jgi:hypothetical protein